MQVTLLPDAPSVPRAPSSPSVSQSLPPPSVELARQRESLEREVLEERERNRAAELARLRDVARFD